MSTLHFPTKNKYSFWACLFIFLAASCIRHHYYLKASEAKVFSHITFDAFGYYMCLPATVIYGDISSTEWIAPMHLQYGVKGGEWLYQINPSPNGKHVYKYLGGVALMQMPFFMLAHLTAASFGYPADGFSLPYQWGIIFASFFYAFLGLWVLRRFLLCYFSDLTTATVLVLGTLGTNWIQYLSIDGAQSHIYIFPLYALILLLTKKWHDKPTAGIAFAAGWVLGLATMSRPTEAIMVFIPLLWNTHTKEAAKAKWTLVSQYYKQVIWAVAGGMAGIAPQLIYWKYATGHFIYDVGSKWYFLNPWFRVLIGFEKGWFIYTPITIFFVVGFWYLKDMPFRRSIIIFCLLNLWIITAWSDWRYGGSYACRALVQSYPVFIVAFAALVEYCLNKKWQLLVLGLGAFLLTVNLFQIYQYNAGIIRYDENSFEYYRSIYLNPWAKPFDTTLPK